MQVYKKIHFLKISDYFTILLWNINNLKSVIMKDKQYFLIKKIQFLAVKLILKYIFENKAQKQKRQMVSDKI